MKNNLQNLSDEQRRKILAAAEIVDGGDMAVMKKIIEFDDTIENATEKIDEFGNKIDETITEAKTKLGETIDSAKKEFESIKEEIDAKLSEVQDGKTPTEDELKSIIIPLIPKVKDGKTPTKKELVSLIEPLIPTPLDGKDANPEDVVPLVIEKLPKFNEFVLEPIEIANKLETLKGDDRLDASAIKNLPDFTDKKANGGGWRNLFQLHDVSLSSPTNGQALVYNSTTRLWEAGSAGSTSPLTTKGDLYTFSTVDARLPVGTNGQVLSADSSTATGLKWVAFFTISIWFSFFKSI